MASELWCVRAGIVPYAEARAAQAAIADARRAGECPDVLILLQHPPVYTRGRRSEPGELPMGEDWYRRQGIEVCETDRGGRVTYHGPGQLVGYPIVDLRAHGDDVHGYVRRLERVMIDSLADWGIEAMVFDGLTGVWSAGAPPVAVGDLGPQGTPVGGAGSEPAADADPSDRSASGTAARPEPTAQPARKLGAIGVHLSRGVTTHGFAINVDNDLRPFEWIVPCGIEACQASSVSRELGARQDLEAFAGTVAERFGRVFSTDVISIPHEELAARISGAGALEPRTADSPGASVERAPAPSGGADRRAIGGVAAR